MCLETVDCFLSQTVAVVLLSGYELANVSSVLIGGNEVKHILRSYQVWYDEYNFWGSSKRIMVQK